MLRKAVLLLIFWPLFSESIELKSGVISKGRETIRNEEQKRVSPIIKSVIENKSATGKHRSIGYTNLGSGNKWYRLNKELVLKGVDVNTQEYLGSFPIVRWASSSRPKETVSIHNLYGMNEWKSEVEFTSHFKMAGCLNQIPLNYADIEADSKNELVLFLNGELVIFSPESSQIVFSAFYQADDWYQGPIEDPELKSDVDGKVYQDVSEFLAYNGHRHGAHRSYTKIYIQDFDNDDNMGIVTWRKTYLSNEVGNPDGFSLLSNEYRHYERSLSNQGEYLPQDGTTEQTIQGWLSANKLTWQKGFPSKSECAGQEDQLIPEMHDPLLNDPDVLK